MIKVNGLEEMPENIGGVSIEERETIIRKDFLSKKVDICTTDFVEYKQLIKKDAAELDCRDIQSEEDYARAIAIAEAEK